MMSDEVPLMFQAQVEGRCQIQRVIPGEKHQQSHQWVDEWTEVLEETIPKYSSSKPLPNKPVLSKQGKNNCNSAAFARPENKAFARPQKEIKDTSTKTPDFGAGVRTQDYKISWRFVSNSGQDGGVIRPVIGVKGWPFYPGSSLKGAFLRACTDDEARKYCGGKTSEKETKPGILRFHGAYPIDINWTNRLVDIIHSQENKQVIKDQKTNANAQISLYQPTLRFGISCAKKLEDSEWKTIWKILERALGEGIGSRVSAGYGQFKEVTKENQILQVKLTGNGVASTLIDGTEEFRCNMFKAALRGHTMRLFGGLTNEATAKHLTKELWGGFAGSNGAIIGSLGVNFDYDDNKLKMSKYEYEPNNKLASMPIYKLEEGALNIVCMRRQLLPERREELKNLAKALVKFSMLLGGFGKSWRRVDHSQFFQEYLKNKSKPMIGCHWEFIKESESFYDAVSTIEDIGKLIEDIRSVFRSWVNPNNLVDNGVQSWREAWHHKKVQVWGRMAENSESHAVKWFHDAYSGSDSIKNTILTGSLKKTGRIWHRMYPRYVVEKESDIKSKKGYVELLTIFPDISESTQNISESTQKFLNFLRQESEFVKIWPLGE